MACFVSKTGMFWVVLCVSLLHAAVGCISDINDIYNAERGIVDTNVQRTYVLCPNKLYVVGFLDYNYNLRGSQEGQPPLPLRSNMKIQCGDDGSRNNLCWITDGHLQIDGTAIRGLGDDPIDNVEIVGLVFMGAVQHSLLVTRSGSITFRDCEWTKFTRSRGPIMLDYYDGRDSNKELVVTFEDCRFHNNQYFGMGAQTALVVANSDQNRLVFRRTVFDHNDMQYNNTSPVSRTHVIESLGPTTIEDSCFVNNLVSSASVAVYGSQFTSSQVHTLDSSGSLCQFASVFENLQQFESMLPSCKGGDPSKTTCAHLPSGGGTDNPNGPVKHHVPFMTNALDYDSAFELDPTTLEGGCNREGALPINGPDAQNTDDATCRSLGGCHVSHTRGGEFLSYRFAHDSSYAVNGEVSVDITVRVSSGTRKEVRLDLLYDGQVEASRTIYAEGLGFREYTSITWQSVPLRADESTHELKVVFVNGNTNLCAVGVSYTGTSNPFPTSNPTLPSPSTPTPTITPTGTSNSLPPVLSPSETPTTAFAASPEPTSVPPTSIQITGSPSRPEPPMSAPPIIWTALSYYEAFDKTPDTSAGGCNVRGDGVDAQLTSDLICINRDKAICNIGWWDPDEYLVYRFSVSQGGPFDIRARAASNSLGRLLGMELTLADGLMVSSKSFNVPMKGYQTFDDLVWASVILEPNDYALKIHSSTGRINLCSVAIFPASGGSDPPGPVETTKVVVPGLYSAMYYTEASVDKTPDNFGDCPYRRDTPVDAKITDDSICQEALTEYDRHCNIAFTEANEYLFYDIKKKPEQTQVKVSIRVASYRSRNIQVQLYSHDNMSVPLASKDIQTIERQSWTTYDTLTVWDQIDIGSLEDFKLKIEFLNGQVNFCSFGIE